MHLREAVDILESWYRADSHVDTLPSACHGRRWRRAMQVAAVLRHWTLERDLPTAVLGFRERPAIITLCWWLAEAGFRDVPWKKFEWTESTFGSLQASANRLAMTSVVILPGRYASADTFASAVRRAICEFGVARIVAWDKAVVGGLPLSLAPRPWRWSEQMGFREHHLLVLPH